MKNVQWCWITGNGYGRKRGISFKAVVTNLRHARGTVGYEGGEVVTRWQKKIAEKKLCESTFSPNVPPSLSIHPSILPPPCVFLWKSSESQSVPTFTQDERCFCLNSSNMKHKWYVNVVFDSV